MSVPQSVIDFFINILQNEKLKEQFQSAIASEDTPTLLKLARERGYDFSDRELQQGLKQIRDILPSPTEIDNLTLTEYRCTRNASYTGNCSGRDDITARQGYYIHAHSEEEAWQQMATRYPNETSAGFTVQDWSENSNKSVVVLRVERDEDGLEVLINQDGKIAKTNDKGDVIGYED
jgi:Nif11 domain